MEISLPGARSMDPEYLDGDRSDESIDYLDINEQDAGLVDSDDAEEEIDDSAQDGGVLGGRSDWGTDPRPAVEGCVLGGRRHRVEMGWFDTFYTFSHLFGERKRGVT